MIPYDEKTKSKAADKEAKAPASRPAGPPPAVLRPVVLLDDDGKAHYQAPSSAAHPPASKPAAAAPAPRPADLEEGELPDEGLLPAPTPARPSHEDEVAAPPAKATPCGACGNPALATTPAPVTTGAAAASAGAPASASGAGLAPSPNSDGENDLVGQAALGSADQDSLRMQEAAAAPATLSRKRTLSPASTAEEGELSCQPSSKSSRLGSDSQALQVPS